jgi:hypothetical protein
MHAAEACHQKGGLSGSRVRKVSRRETRGPTLLSRPISPGSTASQVWTRPCYSNTLELLIYLASPTRFPVHSRSYASQLSSAPSTRRYKGADGTSCTQNWRRERHVMQVAVVCWSVLVHREALPEIDNLAFTAVDAGDE